MYFLISLSSDAVQIKFFSFELVIISRIEALIKFLLFWSNGCSLSRWQPRPNSSEILIEKTKWPHDTRWYDRENSQAATLGSLENEWTHTTTLLAWPSLTLWCKQWLGTNSSTRSSDHFQEVRFLQVTVIGGTNSFICSSGHFQEVRFLQVTVIGGTCYEYCVRFHFPCQIETCHVNALDRSERKRKETMLKKINENLFFLYNQAMDLTHVKEL